MIDFLPQTHLTPGTAFKFTWTRASHGLAPLAQSIALVGMQSLATAAVDEPVAVSTPDQAAQLFGPGCELALMVDTAFKTGELYGQMPRVYAVPLAQPVGGVATVDQLAFAGTVSQSGRTLVRIAGVSIEAPASASQAAADVARALHDAITAATRTIPVLPSVTAETLALTNKCAGVHGDDVVIELVEVPAGITAALTRPTSGAGTASLEDALDNLLAFDVNGIALAHHTAAAVRLASEHVAIAWNPTRKRWRHAFFGETGDSSAAGALAAIDAYAVLVGACKGSPSSPGQIAAVLACIAFATGSPNYNLAGYDDLPLHAPRPSARYSPLDIEELLQLGATPLVAVASRPDRLAITRLVTTQRSLSGAHTLQLADLSVSLTAAYVARQLDQAYARAFGPKSDNPRLVSEAFLEQVRDVVIATLRSIQEAGYIRGLDKRLDQVVVSESTDTAGRLLASVPMEPTPQLMQLAFSMNVHS